MWISLCASPCYSLREVWTTQTLPLMFRVRRVPKFSAALQEAIQQMNVTCSAHPEAQVSSPPKVCTELHT